MKRSILRGRYDVVVIGAGAAGLTAAAALARTRCRVLLVEARDRLGGRIHTVDAPGLPVPIELGAEFIHGLAKPTFDLLARAGAAAIDAGGSHWTVRAGQLAHADDLFAQVRVAIARSSALEKRDMPFATFLKSHLRESLSDEGLAYARMLAEGFDAADTRRASARSLSEEWAGGASAEAPQFRPLGGYRTLMHQLAGEMRVGDVELRLNTAVRNVRWSRSGVTITGQSLDRPFEASARRAIVTLPLGVLQGRSTSAQGVRFTPHLASKAAALDRLAPGPVLKVILRFRHAFWEQLDSGRYRDAAFFHPRGTTFPTFWTALPVRVPLLVAWIAGPGAQKLSRVGNGEIIGEALNSLRTLFGTEAPVDETFSGASLHNWQTDPYARGAYSYVLVDGEGAREKLSEPLARTLFFAGEATDTEEAGTVAGALRSGERAAREVLDTF